MIDVGVDEVRFHEQLENSSVTDLVDVWEEPMPSEFRELLFEELEHRSYRVKSLPHPPDADYTPDPAVQIMVERRAAVERQQQRRVNLAYAKTAVRATFGLGLLCLIFAGILYAEGFDEVLFFRESWNIPDSVQAWFFLVPAAFGLGFLALSRWARQQRTAALWYSLGLFIILQAARLVLLQHTGAGKPGFSALVAGVVLYLGADSARRTAKEQPYG